MYQIRLWDSFFNTWAMIPEERKTLYEAKSRAFDIAIAYSEDETLEVQIYVECLGGTAYQMVGYIDFDEDGDGKLVPFFEECFS